METAEKTVRVAFTKGRLQGLVLECLVDDRGWVTPTKEAIKANQLGWGGPFGWAPVGDRSDWSKWGFIVEAEG
jgi:hypothetical protein